MNQDRREQLLNEPYVQGILKRLQDAEQAKQELEEQFEIVNALAWDHYTVYDVNTQTGNFRAVQVGTYRPPSGSGRPGRNIPTRSFCASIWKNESWIRIKRMC